MMARLCIAIVGVLLFMTAPLHAAERTFDSDGVSLRYFIEGDGETVVLLHGFSGSATGLYVAPGTFDALVDAGYRVVSLDQRGHGDSEKLYGADDYGMHMVEDVRRLLDQLDVDKVHLVGYSMGAKVSNAFRARYPERLLSITLGGYGWPWQSPALTLAESQARISDRDLLPGNDQKALAAVSVGMAALDVDELSLRTNTVSAFAIIGDKDEVVPAADRDRLKTTMKNLRMVIMPGTHAGPDGAPYKPRYAEELIAFLDAQARANN
jgi:pimeloyl-ACP methyl ester carboxylesterase